MRRILIITVVVALGALTYWYLTGSRVQVPSGRVVSLEVFQAPRETLGTITNATGLANVMSVLRSGRPAEPHDCVARGSMEARFADGRTLVVAFAPGHDLSHYEFGMDGRSFTISRSRFLEALSSG